MSALHRCRRAGLPRALLIVAMLTAHPLASLAQTAPAASGSSAPTPMGSMPGMDHSGMDHGSMPGMAMPAAPATVAAPATAGSIENADDTKPAAPAHQPDNPPAMDHSTMPGMDHSAMDHSGMPGMAQDAAPAQDSMPGMRPDSMQGGGAPPDARSPDYSDGVGYGSMKSHMHGMRAIGMLLLDQLEAVDSRNGNGQSFELGGWYGRDENKLWLRSEGAISHGKIEDGDVEAFWNHAIATYWGTQLGARHDLGDGPGRDWLAFGVEGLAPYWFELQATGYVGQSGRTSARLRANHEVLFTQRLILQPELEFNLYGKNDPARRIGSGLSDASLGLRLRYEIRREFAPYLGINWVRRIGTTADYARADGQHVLDQQFVAGFRIWF